MIGTKKEILKYLIELEDDDKKYELKDYRKKRSLNANSYFHSLVNQLARYFGLTDEEMKVKMVLDYGTLARKEDDSIITLKLPKKTNIKTIYEYAEWYGGDDNFNFYKLYKRTHELDSLEFSKLLDGVVNECKEIGIDTIDEIELKRLIEQL